jgi:leader peptidase (prepilin peptidase)/N-methyltransferase
MTALIAGLFGLLIGSFLNVCIYRLPLDLSVVRPRSYCPHCEKMIAWYDNIPVVSYFLLRGRCRSCSASIPLRYLAVELLTGALFFAAVRHLGPTLAGAKLCIFSAIMITLIFSDLEARILPDEFTIGGTVLGIVFAVLVPMTGSLFGLFFEKAWISSVVDALVGAGFTAFILWALGALYQKIRQREGMGLGDVKMAATIGSFLGLQGVLLALMMGSVLGAVTGLIFIKVARKDPASYELPFGSFLGAAAIAVAFW